MTAAAAQRTELDLPVALVTGAGRGIGRSTAIALARDGYRIALISRTVRELRETAAEVENAGGQALLLPADVADGSQVLAAFDRLEDEWGSLSVLVNNAGWARFHPIRDTPLEEWNAVLGVNLTGTFLCCRAAIPMMERAGSGVIVNVASSAGKKGYETQGAYAAAKHGVMGLSKCLALELRESGIRVHAVCPGGVATRLAEEVHPGRDRSGWMQPEDIAEVIRFLVARPSHLTIDEVVIRRFHSDVMF